MNRVWLVVFTLKDGKVSGNKYYITTDFLRLAPSNRTRACYEHWVKRVRSISIA